MIRYQQLLDIIYANKCKNIVEIGTHNGNTAKAMIKVASIASPGEKITYTGFDLFEDYTDELGKKEFNGKVRPDPVEAVKYDLELFCDNENIDCSIDLVKGKTEETLWGYNLYDADICFVDGGHSKETVEGDIKSALVFSNIVVADDYYINNTDVGCKSVVDNDRGSWLTLPFVDIDKKTGMHIAMAVHPTTAYKWNRYLPLLASIKEDKPKKVALFAYDPVIIQNFTILADMHKFDLVENPVDHEDLDLAILQFDNNLSDDEVKEVYGFVRHAKTIVVDGITGDSNSGYKGRGLNLLEEDGKSPVFPMTVDDCTIAIWPAGNRNVFFDVKTRNCVPDEEIQKNIRDNVPLIKHWVVQCKPNGRTAVMVSAGMSLENYDLIFTLREWSKLPDYDIYCVKHSHDHLIANGIIPKGCILLDPRNHVKDYVDNPHKDVTYFVATMCHNGTLKNLVEKGGRVIGYNANVAAGNDTLFEMFGGKPFFSIPGGSASSTRGIALLHCLGYRKFECFAYDLNYEQMPDKEEKTVQGYNKYGRFEVAGKAFYTDLELIAQANDIQALYNTIDVHKINDWGNVELNFYGDNMGQHVARNTPRVSIETTLEDVLKGIELKDAGTIPTPGAAKLNFKVL